MKLTFLTTIVCLSLFTMQVFAQAPATSPAAIPETAKPNEMSSEKKLSDTALNYECKKGSTTRKIQIVFDDPTTKAPCKVQYIKETEDPGNTKVLWTSENRFSYCEEQAANFATKQEQEFGYTCIGKD